MIAPTTSPAAGRVGWTDVRMDTLITIQLGVPAAEPWTDAVSRAFGWFAAVESACSRFDPASEVSRLAKQVGRPVAVSQILAGTLRIALTLAEATGGAFDPAIGNRLEAAGYDRDYRTGRRRRTGIDPADLATYRDVLLDPDDTTVTLRRPVLLDLGAVAKGVAVDLAARELSGTPGAVIDAGGDVYAHGVDLDGRGWRIGIAHPRRRGALLGSVDVVDLALATSGDYARPGHIIDPRPATTPPTTTTTRRPVSVTVLAPTASAADALSTAAAVLPLADGLDLLNRFDQVEALLVTEAGRCVPTTGFPGNTSTEAEVGTW